MGNNNFIFYSLVWLIKLRKQNKALSITLIDFKKAYDSVHRPSLLKRLRHFRLHQILIKLIELTLTNSNSKIKFRGYLPDLVCFTVKTGLKHSLLPSPIGDRVNQFGVLPSPIRDTRHCQLNDCQRVERSLVVIYAEWEVIRAIFGCVLSICVNYYKCYNCWSQHGQKNIFFAANK